MSKYENDAGCNIIGTNDRHIFYKHFRYIVINIQEFKRYCTVFNNSNIYYVQLILVPYTYCHVVK